MTTLALSAPRLRGRTPKRVRTQAELAERAKLERPNLKVLYLSGHTDDVVLRHGVENLENAFLAKPFTAECLTAKVREVLDVGCVP